MSHIAWKIKKIGKLKSDNWRERALKAHKEGEGERERENIEIKNKIKSPC